MSLHTSSGTFHRMPKGDPRFGYAAGRIGILEMKLLSFEQLIPFSDSTVALRELHQILDYAGYPQDPSLQRRVELMEDVLYERLWVLSGRTLLPHFLTLERDYHNLKWFMKNLILVAEASYKEATEAALHGAVADAAILTEEIRTGSPGGSGSWPMAWDRGVLKYGPTDPELLWTMARELLMGQSTSPVTLVQAGSDAQVKLAEALYRAYQTFLTSWDVGSIDVSLDQAYFAHLRQLLDDPACGLEREVMEEYIALKADIVNLQSFLRLRFAGVSTDFLQATLVTGGSVTPDQLLEVARTAAPQSAEELRGLQRAYRNSPAEELLIYYEDFMEAETLRHFNRDADNLLTELTKSGLRVPYAAEVVLAYWRACQMELRNLRLMLSARTRQPSYEEVEALIRNSPRWEVERHAER